jgi:hypothetical protein
MIYNGKEVNEEDDKDLSNIYCSNINTITIYEKKIDSLKKSTSYSEDAQSIDLFEVLRLIKEGELINSTKAKDKCILFPFGQTGSGKSSILSFAAGMKMIWKTNVYVEDENQNINIAGWKYANFKIGHDCVSQTKYLNTVNIDDLVYVDGPGFYDTDGPTTDLVNIACMSSLIKSCKSIVPVLVIDWPMVKNKRGGDFRSFLSFFSNLFSNKSAVLGQSLITIFTKVVCDEYDEEPMQVVLKELQKIYKPTEKTAQNTVPVKTLLSIIIENIEENKNVFIFDKNLQSSKLRKAFKSQSVQIRSPSRVLKITLTDNLKNELQNKLIKMNTCILENIKNDETNYILLYLELLRDLIPYFDDIIQAAFNKSVSLLENYLTEKNDEIKFRFEDTITNRYDTNMSDIHKFIKFYNTINNIAKLRPFFKQDTKIDTIESFEEWTLNVIQYLIDKISETEYFDKINHYLEKINLLIEQFNDCGLGFQIKSKYDGIILFLKEKIRMLIIFEDIITKQNIKAVTKKIVVIDNALKYIGRFLFNNDNEYNIFNIVKQIDNQLLNHYNILAEHIKLFSIHDIIFEQVEIEQFDEIKKKLIPKIKESVKIAYDTLKAVYKCESIHSYLDKEKYSELFNSIKNKIKEKCNAKLNDLKVFSELDNTNNLEEFVFIIEALITIDKSIRKDIIPELRYGLMTLDSSVNSLIDGIDIELLNKEPNFLKLYHNFNKLNNLTWLDNHTFNTNRIASKIILSSNQVMSYIKGIARNISYALETNDFGNMSIILKPLDDDIKNLFDLLPNIKVSIDDINNKIINEIKKTFQTIQKEVDDYYKPLICKEYSLDNETKKTLNFLIKANNYIILINELLGICNHFKMVNDWKKYNIMINNLINDISNNSLKIINNNTENNFELFKSHLDILENIELYENFDKKYKTIYENSVKIVLFNIQRLAIDTKNLFITSPELANKNMLLLQKSKILVQHISEIIVILQELSLEQFKTGLNVTEEMKTSFRSKNFIYIETLIVKHATNKVFITETIDFLTHSYKEMQENIKVLINNFTPTENDFKFDFKFLEIMNLLNDYNSGRILFGKIITRIEWLTYLKNWLNEIDDKFSNNFIHVTNLLNHFYFSESMFIYGKLTNAVEKIDNYFSSNIDNSMKMVKSNKEKEECLIIEDDFYKRQIDKVNNLSIINAPEINSYYKSLIKRPPYGNINIEEHLKKNKDIFLIEFTNIINKKMNEVKQHIEDGNITEAYEYYTIIQSIVSSLTHNDLIIIIEVACLQLKSMFSKIEKKNVDLFRKAIDNWDIDTLSRLYLSNKDNERLNNELSSSIKLLLVSLNSLIDQSNEKRDYNLIRKNFEVLISLEPLFPEIIKQHLRFIDTTEINLYRKISFELTIANKITQEFMAHITQEFMTKISSDNIKNLYRSLKNIINLTSIRSYTKKDYFKGEGDGYIDWLSKIFTTINDRIEKNKENKDLIKEDIRILNELEPIALLYKEDIHIQDLKIVLQNCIEYYKY